MESGVVVWLGHLSGEAVIAGYLLAGAIEGQGQGHFVSKEIRQDESPATGGICWSEVGWWWWWLSRFLLVRDPRQRHLQRGLGCVVGKHPVDGPSR